MNESGGENPINDSETTLPWAGIDDALASPTPAASLKGPAESSAVVVTEDPNAADDSGSGNGVPHTELAPLQCDQTPDEDVTLILTRDESLLTHSDDVIELAIPSLEEPSILEVKADTTDRIDVGDKICDIADRPAIPEEVALDVALPVAPLSPTLIPSAAPDGTAVVDLVEATLLVIKSVPIHESPPRVDFFEPTSPENLSAAEIPGIFALEIDGKAEGKVVLPAPWSADLLPPASRIETAQEEQRATADEDAEAENHEPDPEPVPEEDALDLVSVGSTPDNGGAGAWSIAALCLGVAIIACAVLIPQTDFNRRLVFEREKLRRDLASIEQQVKVNDEFLQRVSSDPSLAERLAQRQMKIIRKGTRVLELQNDPPEEMSPYQLVAVPPPPPMPDYQPKQGMIANACYGVRSRLYLLGGGLMLMAAGLVFGAGATRD